MILAIASMAAGAFMLVFGEADDSPGAQGIGLILAIYGIIRMRGIVAARYSRRRVAVVALGISIVAFVAATVVFVFGKFDGKAPVEESDRIVRLYYYDPSRDLDDAGNIKCSRDGLVPVEREVSEAASMTDILNLLIAGELTDDERDSGLTTEFPLPGVSVTSADLQENGELRVTMYDPENRLVGGSCRTAILAGQVAQTALQFDGVREVLFLPEEVFQP